MTVAKSGTTIDDGGRFAIAATMTLGEAGDMRDRLVAWLAGLTGPGELRIERPEDPLAIQLAAATAASARAAGRDVRIVDSNGGPVAALEARDGEGSA